MMLQVLLQEILGMTKWVDSCSTYGWRITCETIDFCDVEILYKCTREFL